MAMLLSETTYFNYIHCAKEKDTPSSRGCLFKSHRQSLFENEFSTMKHSMMYEEEYQQKPAEHKTKCWSPRMR